mgnify:CR=1 FL=1
MKKTLIALAVTTACANAFAQSRGPEADESLTKGPTRVQLYGIADVGVESAHNGYTLTRVSSGISAGSRLGIRGTEDLGGGYRAVFVLEQRIEMDTGDNTNTSAYQCGTSGCPGVTSPGPAALQTAVQATAANLLSRATSVNSVKAPFDRQAFVGLVTPVGAVLLGRQYTPGYEVMNRFSAFADATAGQLGQGYAALMIRANNAVQYRAELNGFVASLMYSFGGTELARNELSGNKNPFYGANFQYLSPTFSAGIGYNQNYTQVFDLTTAFSTPAMTQDKKKGMQTINAGASYSFGDIKVFGQYMKRKNDNPVLTESGLATVVSAGSTLANQSLALMLGNGLSQLDADLIRGSVGKTDTQIYSVSANYQISTGSILASYARAKDQASPGEGELDAIVDHFAVAYFHDLSRRTQLYGVAALAKNKGDARMGLGAAGYSGGFTSEPGQDSRVIQLGIRHAF